MANNEIKQVKIDTTNYDIIAKKATQDGSGNIITDTYATKTDIGDTTVLETTSKEIVGAINEINNKPLYYSQGLSYELLSNNNETYYSVTGQGTCKDTDIIIPPTHNGLPVKAIASYSFDENRSITSITIPDSVTSIGSIAFRACPLLTSVIIPDSVTNINSETFYYCTSLRNITIPKSVTSIKSYAFSGCTSLTNITIPKSVTSMEGYVFSGCSLLTIYCEADSQPSGWNSNWNPTNCSVVWDFANDFVAVNEKIDNKIAAAITTALNTEV